jgi:alanine dehydrogenase
MRIGVIKEVKQDENRVALQPCQAKALADHGHEVLVEEAAGIQSGYMDDEYRDNLARISSKATILKECELLLKVKTPLVSEYADYSPEQTLFTYFHLDENIPPERINALISSGYLGIALEWVEEAEKDFPLLEPMSRLTGYLFAHKAAALCTRYKGLLCGRHEDYLPGANILIIGVGTVGMSALKYAMDNHFNIRIVDKNPHTINERLSHRYKAEADYVGDFGMQVIRFDTEAPQTSKQEVAKFLSETDMVINCAVRRLSLPKSRMEYLIDRSMIQTMQRHSIVCDATACDRDMIETCVSHESLYEFDVIDDVIHYNCDHIPSYVGRTATDLLTTATFPYVLEIANKGAPKTIKTNTAIRKAVNCYRGKVTHKYSADKKNMVFHDIMDLL